MLGTSPRDFPSSQRRYELLYSFRAAEAVKTAYSLLDWKLVLGVSLPMFFTLAVNFSSQFMLLHAVANQPTQDSVSDGSAQGPKPRPDNLPGAVMHASFIMLFGQLGTIFFTSFVYVGLYRYISEKQENGFGQTPSLSRVFSGCSPCQTFWKAVGLCFSMGGIAILSILATFSVAGSFLLLGKGVFAMVCVCAYLFLAFVFFPLLSFAASLAIALLVKERCRGVCEAIGVAFKVVSHNFSKVYCFVLSYMVLFMLAGLVVGILSGIVVGVVSAFFAGGHSILPVLVAIACEILALFLLIPVCVVTMMVAALAVTAELESLDLPPNPLSGGSARSNEGVRMVAMQSQSAGDAAAVSVAAHPQTAGPYSAEYTFRDGPQVPLVEGASRGQTEEGRRQGGYEIPV
uniref:Uncharacterized protein n=1 Tax=Chromera velia CCMP2878 TaxID=1169474 RepID=A0A0G4GHG7_9ALVE|eukprot:Cvel_654.t1-p1 / transcript=Cvel_654.t1 / gene=Cvel_654 / organism=Chromera_velia_CCMP2878 / gene_product=hypothetical protein / transcript_product=hypothetical protein / location=Cvel_scaffold20:64631-65833(-) / protein_length=401 / sequence_SO=supercontig / SO=protein_coding / is_pseudo=false